MNVRVPSQFYRSVGFAAIAILAVGCTNSLFGRLYSTTASSVDGTNSSGPPPMTVAQIVKDNTDPTNTIDLVGDGTGQMGQLCTSTSSSTTTTGTSSNTGASTCQCIFTWTTAQNSTESAEVDTSYHEQDLLRCGYTGVIPQNVATVSIKVLISSLGAYSNSVNFSVDGIYGTNDATDPTNYSLVQRYQCRDTPTIYQPTNGSDGVTKGLIYDPWQSDDPNFSYPLDFYATNFGGAMAFFTSQGLTGFNCPGNPDDAGAGLNFRVYSVDPLNGDQILHGNTRQYSPPTGEFDRSTFFLANQPTSTFTLPLNAYVAPQIISGGSIPPIGYGAQPISTGSGTESCPNASVPIPPNTHWVKVWQFRATLPKRTFIFSQGVQTAGSILCNPAASPANTNGGIPRDDCAAPGTVNANGVGGNTTISAGNLADRLFFDLKMCMQFQNIGAGNPNLAHITPPCLGSGQTNALACTSDPVAGQRPPYQEFAFGTDFWEPYHDCVANPPLTDPLNICNQSRAVTPGEAPFDPINAPTVYAPDLTNPRSDFLFVVTPTTVNSADMVQENTNATPYIPIRFPSIASCQNPNPTSANCPGGFSYGVDMYDVNVPSNPPAGTNPTFPMCALQPNSGVSL